MDRNTAHLVALAREWLTAFNARDLDALLALYEDDAVHTSPKLRAKDPSTKGEIRGVAALRKWWADSMKRMPELHYEERFLTAMEDRVIMEYTRLNPGDPPLAVAEVLVVAESGKISASHVFHG